MKHTRTMSAGAVAGELGQHRYTAGRVVVWFGLLAPLAVSESRPASEIAADPITLITLFRGITPAVCLLASVALLQPRLWPEHRGEWLAVAFPTIAMASTLWSVSPVATMLKAAVLAAVYGLVIVLVRSWRTLEEAVRAVATVAQFLVISSLVCAILVPQTVFAYYYRWGGVLRLRGLFPEIHPVPLGWMALVGLLGALSGLGFWEWQRRPAVRLIIGAACFTALVLAQTRAAWAGAAVTFLVFIALQGARRLSAALVVLFAAAAITAATLAPTVTHSMTSFLTRGENQQQVASLGGRLPMWQRAFDLWSERPLTGYGYYAGHRYGPYAEAFAEAADRGNELTEHAYIDGAYVETMLDLGLIGLAPLAFLAMSAFGYGVRRIRVGPRDASDAVAILILGALLMDSVLSYSWQTPSYQGQLLLALALAIQSAEIRYQRSAGRHPFRRLYAAPVAKRARRTLQFQR